MWNKIADKIVKPEANSINAEKKIDCSTRKKKRNIKRIKTGLIKMDHYKFSKLFDKSFVSKLVARK